MITCVLTSDLDGVCVPSWPDGEFQVGHALRSNPAGANTVRAISAARNNGWTSLDVRPDVQAAFNAAVQDALPSTVYNAGGCSSYYLDVNGRNSFNWPWSTGRLRSRVSRFDRAAYVVTAPDAESVPA